MLAIATVMGPLKSLLCMSLATGEGPYSSVAQRASSAGTGCDSRL